MTNTWENRKEDPIYKEIATKHGEEKADKVLKLSNALATEIEGDKAFGMAYEIVTGVGLSKS